MMLLKKKQERKEGSEEGRKENEKYLLQRKDPLIHPYILMKNGGYWPNVFLKGQKNIHEESHISVS